MAIPKSLYPQLRIFYTWKKTAKLDDQIDSAPFFLGKGARTNVSSQAAIACRSTLISTLHGAVFNCQIRSEWERTAWRGNCSVSGLLSPEVLQKTQSLGDGALFA